MYLCIKGIDIILPLFKILIFDFGIVPMVWYLHLVMTRFQHDYSFVYCFLKSDEL